MLEQIVKMGLELSLAGGARYAELAWVEQEEKELAMENGRISCADTRSSKGLSARVLAGDRWGFAACPAGGKQAVQRLVKAALEATRLAPRPERHVELGPPAPVQGQWHTPYQIDPFAVGVAQITEVLRAADAAMDEAGITWRQTRLRFVRERRVYVNSEGTELEQTLLLSGGGVQVLAAGAADTVRRSWPGPEGSYAGAGYEYIADLDLPGNGRRIAREAVALLKAPPCPAGVADVIVHGSMLAALLHYTCGYRARLGLFGSIPVEELGVARLGSPLLNIVADAAYPDGAGSFGYDCEGTPARSFALVKNGVYTEFFSGREQAAAVGRAGTGALRAPSWFDPPLPWPTNLVLQPGSGSFKDLVAGIERGIVLDTCSAFAPDPNLQGFVAAAEAGWLIEYGQVRRMVRAPLFKGYPAAFWSGCDAVAGEGERFQLGLLADGIPAGYSLVPVRIRGVKVGAEL